MIRKIVAALAAIFIAAPAYAQTITPPSGCVSTVACSAKSIGLNGGAGTATLTSDAANTLALRNGTSAQALYVYNTYTDASNYERGVFSYGGGVLSLGSEKAGTGASTPVQFRMGGVNIFTIATNGTLLWNTDNAFDIGASGGSRPRNIYVGTGVVTPYAQFAPVAVSALATCNAGASGRRRFVNDSTVAAASNFGVAVTGGGSNVVPVYCDATSWKIG